MKVSVDDPSHEHVNYKVVDSHGTEVSVRSFDTETEEAEALLLNGNKMIFSGNDPIYVKVKLVGAKLVDIRKAREGFNKRMEERRKEKGD